MEYWKFYHYFIYYVSSAELDLSIDADRTFYCSIVVMACCSIVCAAKLLLLVSKLRFVYLECPANFAGKLRPG